MNETERMKELVKKLNEKRQKPITRKTRGDRERLSYDTLYDELQVLEEKTGVTLAGNLTKSATGGIGRLPKSATEVADAFHDKTKDVEVLRGLHQGSKNSLLSWKMDGLTVVLTYRGGTLAKAVTRGNGVIRRGCHEQCEVFENIPLKIRTRESWFTAAKAIIRYSILRRSTGSECCPSKIRRPKEQFVLR